MTQATPITIPAPILRISEAVQAQWERVQPRVRRLGGFAGLAQGVILLALMFVNFAVFQNAHLTTGANLSNPKVFLPIVARQPLGFILTDALYVLLSVTIGLLALAVFDVLGPRSRSISLPATAAGLISALLFLIYGLYSMIRLPMLASDYMRHPVARDPAFTSYVALTSAFSLAAVVILGIWFVASSWAVLRAKALSRGIPYVGLVWGVLALLGSVGDASFYVLYELGQEFLWPIWAFWIGVALLRPARPVVQSESTLPPPEVGAVAITEEPNGANGTHGFEPVEGENA